MGEVFSPDAYKATNSICSRRKLYALVAPSCPTKIARFVDRAQPAVSIRISGMVAHATFDLVRKLLGRLGATLCRMLTADSGTALGKNCDDDNLCGTELISLRGNSMH